MGVYQILNKANGKRWVSTSMDLHGAGNSAFFQLRLGSHPNKALQEDWRRYGEEEFAFEKY